MLCGLAADKPNVIVIMTDDQGYGDMSCHGNPILKTPNIDQLYAESVRFTDFHVSPYCTPTRASLMTGRYAARTGAYRTSSGRTSLHAREKTLGDLFTQNGYASGIFGKWHLGDCAPSRPMDCGFEQSVWHRCGGLTQISDYWTNDYFDDTYLVGDRWKSFEGYCTDVWFDEAMNFMVSVSTDAGGSKPFFVYLPTNAPHGPYLVEEKWAKPYQTPGVPASTAKFRGMVANFDWNLGRLHKFLEDESLAEDTIVIFLTDNGTSAGAQFGKGGRITGFPKDPAENAGMRGGKSSPYDGGHRVPLFVRWPKGKLGPPRDISNLSAHLDITPTLIDLCDLKRPATWASLDGRSLAPLLRGNATTTWPDRVIHSQMHGGNGFVAPGDPWAVSSVITSRWRLVEGKELFDIQSDPMQKQNVAEAHPEVVERLRKEHLDWFASVKTGMEPTRIDVGSQVENPTELTSQEWVMASGNPPWSHSHVVRRTISNGPWMLDVKSAGAYRITLSRYPRYIQESLDSKSAKIQIAGQTKVKNISQPDATEVSFEVDLPEGETQLLTTLTMADGREHGAYFASVEHIESSELAILWAQYCVDQEVLKMTVHTNADPRKQQGGVVHLEVMKDGTWQTAAKKPVESLTAMAKFRVNDWDRSIASKYRVTAGASVFEGTIRREPDAGATLKLMGVACVNDIWFPYENAVAQMISQDPDLVYFAGDQIYESNSGGEVIMAETEAEVPEAMANYLAKWRKFGLTFRDLLRDRPSLIVTDDHDVYANDLWGDGGRRMNGDRTTGGYPTHPKWVNAVEDTQTWHLPDPANEGPWGDGIEAYFTSLNYGGVSFAILEDRKFKSPPSAVLSEAVDDPLENKPNKTLEVIKDPSFDVSKLDRPDLHLLGEAQEKFLGQWAREVVEQKQLAAVLSQSPFVNIGNYDARFGDMDANGWPMSARDRALRLIAPSKALMLSGDIHLGTLLQHGIDDWGDGPWSFSMPAFSSKKNRSWTPRFPSQGREIPGVEGSGNHHDRFGNKMSVAGVAHGFNGYGIVLFDNTNKRITIEVHTMNDDREPSNQKVPGWPLILQR